MASILKNVLIRMDNTENEEDKLLYAAEFIYLTNIMCDMLAAFASSTDKEQRKAALDILDKAITKQLFSNRYGSGNGTPSA